MLIQSGATSEKGIQQCLERAKKQKMALGKVLVDEGQRSSEQLKNSVDRQILEIFIHIFQWKKGEFVYKDRNLNLNWLVMLKINTLQLLMDAFQQIDENADSNRKRKLNPAYGNKTTALYVLPNRFFHIIIV